MMLVLVQEQWDKKGKRKFSGNPRTEFPRACVTLVQAIRYNCDAKIQAISFAIPFGAPIQL